MLSITIKLYASNNYAIVNLIFIVLGKILFHKQESSVADTLVTKSSLKQMLLLLFFSSRKS